VDKKRNLVEYIKTFLDPKPNPSKGVKTEKSIKINKNEYILI